MGLPYFVTRSGEDLNGLDNEKDVEEVRFDHAGMEGSVLFLEDNRHDIVANVSLSLDLTGVIRSERQERADMEHDLFLIVVFVVGDRTIRLFADIETSSISKAQARWDRSSSIVHLTL